MKKRDREERGIWMKVKKQKKYKHSNIYPYLLQGQQAFPNYKPTSVGRPGWQRDKTYILTCAPNEDSNQLAYPHNMIRVLIVRMKRLCLKRLCFLHYPKRAHRRFWTDCANAQADLILRLVHMFKYVFWRCGQYQERVVVWLRQCILAGRSEPVYILYGWRHKNIMCLGNCLITVKRLRTTKPSILPLKPVTVWDPGRSRFIDPGKIMSNGSRTLVVPWMSGMNGDESWWSGLQPRLF